MPALDDLWDYDDPARTQLARALGLQGRFDEGHAILGQVDADPPADDRIRVRALLERGRLLRSSSDPAAAVTLFEGAWDLDLGREGEARPYLARAAALLGEG